MASETHEDMFDQWRLLASCGSGGVHRPPKPESKPEPKSGNLNVAEQL